MSPEQALEWVLSTQHFGIKLGLDNVRRILDALGQPARSLSIIHVAGTNGKGSVSAMMDAISRASGRRTGLYTSPHLINFRERIRVNTEKIGSEDLTRLLIQIHDLCEEWEHLPTFFEITTAVALRHFADQKCDLVILETGMGGRLDATNAVVPKATLITPIALDHMQWLGTTLAEVAREKAGIFKTGVPAVSAVQASEAAAVLRAVAAEQRTPLHFIEESWDELPLPLKGSFQKANAALAIAGLKAAGFEDEPEIIRQALTQVSWPGRFQQVEDRIVLDGAHNPHAALHLVENWREQFGERKATLVFGVLQDKDHAPMLKSLAPIAKEILLVPVRSQRGASPESLLAQGLEHTRVMDSLDEGLKAARLLPNPILITGSLFLVGEAMELLGFEP